MTEVSSEGIHYGEIDISGRSLSFNSKNNGKGIFVMPLDNVEQCVVSTSNRNDLEIQFAESKDRSKDSLVRIVFHLPSAKKSQKVKKEGEDEDEDEDDEDEDEEEEETAAEGLQGKIMDIGVVDSATGDILVEFTKDQGNFISPRGKYALKFTSTTMQMRGTPYTFNVPYDNMDSAFLLRKGLTSRFAVVVCLKVPIRVGNQKYHHLVLETNDDKSTTVELNFSQEELDANYGGLEKTMTKTLSTILASIIKEVAKKKVFVPQKFESANGGHSIRCVVKANDGLLYPLAKSFIFIHKPTIVIKFEDIESVEFERYTPAANAATRNFDMKISLRDSAVKAGEARDYTFVSIDRAEYKILLDYLESKKINVVNPQDTAQTTAADLGIDDDDDEDEEDDGDYESGSGADDDEGSGSGSGSGSDDSDNEGSGDEAPVQVKKEKKEKKENKEKRERAPKSESRKRPAKESTQAGGDKKRAKKVKDKNAPKGVTTAFMSFSNQVRGKYKAENPSASITELSKIIGAKWRELTAEEKEPFEELTRKDKKRYEEEMRAYKAGKEAADAMDDE